MTVYIISPLETLIKMNQLVFKNVVLETNSNLSELVFDGFYLKDKHCVKYIRM